jgi:glycosyltransferase involved in cell wall biosynthesis
VQFNFGFFALRSFAQLVDRLAEDEIAVIVALHRTTDVERPDISIRLRDAKSSLSLARRILVHSVHDLNRLKALGLVENVALFPMGVPQPVKDTRNEGRNRLGLGKSRLIIATFGYLLPHKGLRELIRATAVLRGEIGNVDLLMMNALYPAAESEAEHQACRREIASLRLERHVRLLTDFFDESEILSLLATSDIVVYPYQESEESASAAVRLGLASLTPVACTPLAIFDDVGSVIAQLPGTTPNEIAAGLKQLLFNESALRELTVRQRAWVAAHSWATLGRRLDGLIRGETSDRFALSRKATIADSNRS